MIKKVLQYIYAPPGTITGRMWSVNEDGSRGEPVPIPSPTLFGCELYRKHPKRKNWVGYYDDDRNERSWLYYICAGIVKEVCLRISLTREELWWYSKNKPIKPYQNYTDFKEEYKSIPDDAIAQPLITGYDYYWSPEIEGEYSEPKYSMSTSPSCWSKPILASLDEVYNTECWGINTRNYFWKCFANVVICNIHWFLGIKRR